MKLNSSFRLKIPALSGALALAVLALLAPKPARAFCPEVIDTECDWSDGGYCQYSSCATHPTVCDGPRTGDVYCFDAGPPYTCCHPQ
jgi:hypothetical protein